MAGQHDLRAGADVRIKESHAMIHRGIKFTAWALDRSLDDDATLVIAFQTPTDKQIHMRYSFAGAGSVDVEVIQSADWDIGTGQRFTVQAKDLDNGARSHILGNASGANVANEVVINPDNVTGTDIVDRVSTFTGNIDKNEKSYQELILDKDNEYAIRLTANGGQNGGWLKLHWYELRAD